MKLKDNFAKTLNLQKKVQLGTHEWACSVESIVNLCATSRTTTMGEMRIVVEEEMRNEYDISSALLPAISTLDSCYLLLHLNKWFLLLFFQLLSLQLAVLLQLNTRRNVSISHSLGVSFLLTAGKLIGSRCGRSVLNFILICHKKQLLVP